MREEKKLEDLFAEIDEKGESIPTKSKPLIVIDAQNVAMRMGKNQVFKVKGIQIVAEFFQKNGHEVICFMPDYLLDQKKVIQRKKENAGAMNPNSQSKAPDDFHLLKALEKKGIIVGTPSQDYDDSYCISQAKKKGGFMVTNDKFRDYIAKIGGLDEKKKEQDWLKRHIMTYTFNKEQFLPNPDCELFAEYPLEEYKSFPVENL